MLTVVMSPVGDRLKQGPDGDTEMGFLVKSFSDITPLETTRCLPHICVDEYFILWSNKSDSQLIEAPHIPCLMAFFFHLQSSQ